jgi:predicted nuclease of predicted toxin-antitoxin system
VRFLIDADLPHSLTEIFAAHGHDAIHVRDVALGTAADGTIAEYARATERCIITGDFDFADIRAYPPSHYFGIVVLVLPRDATRVLIRFLVSEFLAHEELPSTIQRKLAIVEPGRIRVRE